VTPKQIDREIARELAAVAAHRRKADEAQARVRLLEELRRLHLGENRSNLSSNMQAETAGKSRRTRISAGRAEKDTPSRQAAVAADLTDLMIAEITGAGRSTVQAWHSGARAVPRRHAEKLAKRGIPVDCWAKLSD
jgi:hypothetical protein